MEDGLFKPEGFAEPTDFQGSEDPVFVTSQALEGSSAKTYDVLTQMIELERSYEIKINIIKELSDLNQTSNTLMQLS
jgi:flagellar basal body rod protein FlgF